MSSINGHRESNSLRREDAMHGGELFDRQAAGFDQRAGLPESCCSAIASAVLESGEVTSRDLIVEIGPGTGQLGQWLRARARYVGLDLSAGMLREFRNRAGACFDRSVLVQADANQGWPIASGAVRAVFSSRALHLLDHEHVAREMFRVAWPRGATLIIGRVEREPASVRSRMAREMNRRLSHYGFEGRRAEGRNQKLFDSFHQRGAQALDAVRVATWKTRSSPRDSLASWRSVSKLGGIAVEATLRERILTELEDWAVKEFGRLDAEFEAEETYVLRPLRVHGL